MIISIPWHQMTKREQLVWAATYASHETNRGDAVRLADQTVLALRELDLDNNKYSEPEYEAARYGPGLTVEEFCAWYPVALKITRKGSISAGAITELACRDAYETYERCSTDFY